MGACGRADTPYAQLLFCINWGSLVVAYLDNVGRTIDHISGVSAPRRVVASENIFRCKGQLSQS